MEKILTLEDYQSAIERNPCNLSAYLEAGQALRQAEKFEKAISNYSQGLSYLPFEMLLYRFRGHTYLNLGNIKQALSDFSLALRISPENWDCLYHFGVAAYIDRDFKRASMCFEKCIKVSDDADLLSAASAWLWCTYIRSDQPLLAQKVLDDYPRDIVTTEYSAGYSDRMQVYIGNKESKEVLAYAETLDDHMFATYAYGLGLWFETHGDTDLAHRVYQNITQRNEKWFGFAEHAAQRRLEEL